MNDSNELKGVGGWLGIYVWLGLIGGIAWVFLFSLTFLFSDLVSPENHFYNFELLAQIDAVVFTAIATLNAVSCFLLLRRNPKGLKLVKGVLLTAVYYHGLLFTSSIFNDTLRPLFFNVGTFFRLRGLGFGLNTLNNQSASVIRMDRKA